MADSVVLLNAIRDSIGGDYAERIPQATRTNITRVGNTILSYTPHMNAMFTQLMNRISETVVKKMDSVEDIYAIFKNKDINFGDTIQKIYVDVLEAHAFEGTATQNPASMLSIEKGTIHVEYTSVDRRIFYKTTISIPELKEAFVSPSAFENLVRALVDGMVRSYALDRYIMLSNTFRKHASYVLQGYFGNDGATPTAGQIPVNALVVPSSVAQYNLTTGEVEFSVTGAKTFLKLLRKVSRGLKFAHKLGYYSLKSGDEDEAPASGENHVDKDSLKVIKAVRTPLKSQVVALENSVMAEIDVDALAVLFHMDKAEIEQRQIELEDDVLSHPISEDQSEENTGLHIMGFISDVDAVERGKSFEANESFKNPEHQYINYWSHYWGYMAVSKFADFVPIVCSTYTPSEGD